MKTLEITLYKFDELSEKVKKKIIEKKREKVDHSWFYDEAYETVKAFHELFGTKTDSYSRSWLDVSTSHIDDNIVNLSGLRLRTFIMNNFWDRIMTRKYISYRDKSGNRNEPFPRHPMRKSNLIKHGPNKGQYYDSYYSNIFRSIDCPLTGVCYDQSILWPIIKFVRKPDERTFEDLMEECFNELKKDLKEEEEYNESDEHLIEEIHNDDLDYLEDGREY